MRRFAASVFVGIVALDLAASLACAQVVSLSGSALALKSRASTTLSGSGYVGTYLTVPTGGATVNFNVNATGSAGHMNLVIADSKFGFAIGGGTALDYTTGNVALPAGTYLVRAERDYANNANATFSVNNLSVNTVSGSTAQFSNVTAGSANAASTALAAANTYINNYRKGNVDLAVQGIAPGTSVEVRLKNSEFKFGTAVPSSLTTYLAANPASGSTAQKYQQRLLANFNSITPENDGKWSGSDTATQLRNTDRMLQFADANDLRVRQHNLVWGSQQPTRIFNDSNPTDVNALFNKARSTDAATATAAKASIQSNIDARIASYVGGVNSETGGSTGKPAIIRAQQYDDLDVYNESYHTGSNASTTNANYWQVLGANAAAGPSVAADIYNRTAAAVAAAGASTRLFTNEYNVLDYDGNQYGQWYSQHIESIRAAGGNVGGIGAQFYTEAAVGTASGNVDPYRVNATLANLSSQGLPLEITEFGSKVGADPAGALTTALTLSYGSADVTGFTLWGMYDTGSGMYAGAKGSVLYDNAFNLTAAGAAYQALRSQWTTDVTTTINADGSITLPNGAFYGDYDITVKGVHYTTTFDAATKRYLLVVLKGDFNNSEALEAGDMDALFAAAEGTTAGATPLADARFDVNGDGQVIKTPGAAGSDADYWVHTIKHTEYGDANLDGHVNFDDLVVLAQNYNVTTGAGWADASFNGDGAVNFDDLVVLAQHYNFDGTGSLSFAGTAFENDWALARALVPEPTSLLSLAVSMAAVTFRRCRATV